MLKFLPVFLLCIGFVTAITPVAAQEFTGAEVHLWTPLIPKPDSTIANGNQGIYIRVSFNKLYSIQPKSVRVFVDNDMLDANVKVSSENLITAIYTKPLRPGKHKITVDLVSTTGYAFEPFEWFFFVPQPFTDSTVSKPKNSFTVNGNITAETRITNLQGPGSNLRQEPPHTTQTIFNIATENRQLKFGIRGFLTSDEQLYTRNFQSRNYIQANAEWRGIKLTVGDMNPVFDQLVMTGARIKGAQLHFKYKRIDLKLIRGLLAREVEGNLIQLGESEQAPPNLQSDSTYIEPGVFRRTISAVRLQWGMLADGNTMGISVMRSNDNINSIQYGIAPKDNTVIGFDHVITSYNNRIKISYGIAISGFTNDISNGAMTKDELDSMLRDPNNRIDPQKLKPILIINESSTVLSNRSVTTYINTAFKLSQNHSVFIENKKYGASYVSFANPFIRADQRSWEVQERFGFFKRALIGNVRYMFLQNNLSQSSFSTLLTRIYSGLAILRLGKKWPSLTVTAMHQQRRNRPVSNEISIFFLNNDDITTITANLSYSLKTGTLIHSLNLNTVQSERINKINPANNNKTQIYSASLQQQFGQRLQLNYQYNASQIEALGGAFTSLTTSYGLTTRYKFLKYKFEIGTAYYNNQMGASPFSVASSRPVTKIFLTYKGFKGKILSPINLYIEAATAPYMDELNPLNNYTESYIYVRLNYTLGK